MYDSWYEIRNFLFSRKRKNEDIIEKQFNTMFDLNNEKSLDDIKGCISTCFSKYISVTV